MKKIIIYLLILFVSIFIVGCSSCKTKDNIPKIDENSAPNPTNQTIPVASVCLDSNSYTMYDNQYFFLNASVSPDNATDQSLTWSSSNSMVATISTQGFLVALSPGSTIITVKTSNGKTFSCNVTVLSSKTVTYITGKNVNQYFDITSSINAPYFNAGKYVFNFTATKSPIINIEEVVNIYIKFEFSLTYRILGYRETTKTYENNTVITCRPGSNTSFTAYGNVDYNLPENTIISYSTLEYNITTATGKISE